MSELQSGFAGGVGEGRDPSRVRVPTAVEDDLGDAGRLGGVGELRAELLGLRGLVAVAQLVRRGRRQGDALAVVDHLDEQVARRPGDDQARTLGTADDLLAQAEVPARPGHPARGRDTGRAAGLLDDAAGAHFLPALPALRRIASPWYRTPLPLYGSGLRSLRMLAATSPTFCLSMPSTTKRVGTSTRKVMPSGGVTSSGCEKPRANSRSLPLAVTR